MDPHETRLRVRYGETDQMGVVHHANYALYVEESRTNLMRERGCSYAELERRGFGLPVRRMEMRFRAPALYEEELVVRTRIGRVGAASVTFESEIYRLAGASGFANSAVAGAPLANSAVAGAPLAGTTVEEAHLASITVELACVDLRAKIRKPVVLPDDLRALLESPRPAGADLPQRMPSQRLP